MEHENFKNIEIGGRKWRIEKFDAITACYLAYQLMAQSMPMGLNKQIPGMPSSDGAKIMSEIEFKEFIKKCLSVCFEYLPVGKVPVIRAEGTWGVLNIEDDPVLVIGLLIHAITFNVQGFFDGGALTELKASLADIKLFNASTSTNSSTPQ